MMNWLINIFGTSDYLDRDPYRKFVVGIAHAWFGGFLARVTPLLLVKIGITQHISDTVVTGIVLTVIALGFACKEYWLDLSRGRSRDLRIWADSLTDLSFTMMGAATVVSDDWRYGLGVLAAGLAYFVAGRLFDGK